MDDFEKWERDFQEKAAEQGLEYQELIAQYRKDLENLAKEKRAMIDKIGIETAEISIVFAKKERELTEKRDADAKEMQDRHLKELYNSDDRDSDQKAEIEQTAENVSEEEGAATATIHHHHQEQETADEKPEPEMTQTYQDVVMALKKDRDRFMRDHFSQLAEMSMSPNLSQDDIDYFLDVQREALHRLAIGSYAKLLDHPQNPYHLKALEDIRKEEMELKAERDRQEEIAKAEREREKEEDRLLKEEQEREKRDQKKQETDERIKMYRQMREEILSSNENDLDAGRYLSR